MTVRTMTVRTHIASLLYRLAWRIDTRPMFTLSIKRRIDPDLHQAEVDAKDRGSATTNSGLV